MMNGNPALVAPRPVRITTAGAAFSFLKPVPLRLVSAPVASDNPSPIEEQSETRSASPTRASPRSPLPSEALEEFLSILRPALFSPPRSPVNARNRRQPSINAFHTPSPSEEGVVQILEIQDDTQAASFRWFTATSSVLSSPVSRSNTRNPFQRHVTYRAMSASPSPSPLLSPAAIPLPLPAADEL